MTAATKTGVPSPRLPLCELSPREVEVLTLAADGLSNVEIGVHLHLAASTVKGIVARIGVKLGCGDRAGMVGAAYRRGVLLAAPEQPTPKPERDRERVPSAAVPELDGLMLRIVVLLVQGASLDAVVPLARRAHRMAVVTRRLR